MKKKPKYLIGEVKEFINELDLSSICKCTASDDVDELEVLRLFYSQPFQPEMITEYFVGWVERTSKTKEFFSNPGLMVTIYFISKNNWNIEQNRWGLCFEYFSETLSQFITNCIQAEIKLEWK